MKVVLSLFVFWALQFNNSLLAQSNSNYSYDADGRLSSDLSEGIISIEWNNFNKVVRVTRADTCHSPDVEFRYDGSGNRIMKLIKPRNGNGVMPEYAWEYTYYVHDGSGGTMALYQDSFTKDSEAGFTEKFRVNEQHVYAGSRVGYYAPPPSPIISRQFTASVDNVGNFVDSEEGGVIVSQSLLNNVTMTCGNRYYMLQGHHGDVQALISNRKLISNDPFHYQGEVISATDYYPFGMTLSGRTFNDETSRYGFAGKEKDNEIKGKNNSYDFGARIYDPRLGRWLTLDPLEGKYPGHSPYNFALNSPLMFNDPDGNEVVDSKGNPIGIDMQQHGNKWDVSFKFNKGTSWTEQQKFRNGAKKGFNELAKTEHGRAQIQKLQESKRKIELIFGEDVQSPSSRVSIQWGIPKRNANKADVSEDKNEKEVDVSHFIFYINEPVFVKGKNQARANFRKLDAVTKLLRSTNSKAPFERLEAQRKKIYDEIVNHPIISGGLDINGQREFLSMRDNQTFAALLSGVIEIATNDASAADYLRFQKKSGKSDDEEGFKFSIPYTMMTIYIAKEVIREFRDIQQANKK